MTTPLKPSVRPGSPRGVERPAPGGALRAMIHRRGRDLGGLVVRAAFGGSLNLTWLLLRVVAQSAARTA